MSRTVHDDKPEGTKVRIDVTVTSCVKCPYGHHLDRGKFKCMKTYRRIYNDFYKLIPDFCPFEEVE